MFIVLAPRLVLLVCLNQFSRSTSISVFFGFFFLFFFAPSHFLTQSSPTISPHFIGMNSSASFFISPHHHLRHIRRPSASSSVVKTSSLTLSLLTTHTFSLSDSFSFFLYLLSPLSSLTLSHPLSLSLTLSLSFTKQHTNTHFL